MLYNRVSRFGFLVVAVLVLSSAVSAQVVDRTTITNKVMCGYQGWFACPGDGNDPSVGWNHWRGAYQFNTDIWPDTREYDPSDLFLVPDATLTQGGTPYLFSNFRQGAVNTQFRWMLENGIDGVYHQRFVGGFVDNMNDPWQHKLDVVLQNVMNASATYGRAWALEYDISGVSTGDLYAKLTGDWTYLCNAFNIKNHSRYLYHNGKPVVVIWGFGFGDRPGTPAIAQTIVDWFKADGCFVILGVPRDWRTISAWSTVYRSVNGITPWTVGSYQNWSGINSYKTTAQADLNLCNSLGMVFIPTAWPRFGWDNMMGYSCGQSKISPRLGQHLWDQVYMYKGISVPAMFIAMFDEYDESTAIMKLTDNVPTTGCWWTTEGLGSDWYLRLVNQASRLQRGEIARSQTLPISAATSPDNAQIISHTIPSSMVVGRQYAVSITMKNVGETVWCDPYWWNLGAVGDSDPFAATRHPVPTGTVVMRNQQYTFSFTMTAPGAVGNYTTDWRMVHEAIRWFGATLTVSVAVGPDVAPPGAVTSFAAPAGDGQVALFWHNPSDSDFTGTMVRYKTGGYPTSATDGTLVCDRSASPGSNDNYIHTGLTNSTLYYYAAYAHDAAPNYATAANSIGRPGVAPGLVTSFVAAAGDTLNSLSWHNPNDGGFTGTMIRYRTDTYPVGPSDGTLACNKANTPGSNDTFVHASLSNGTTYYYSAFAYNSAPNYSTAVTAVATPLSPTCFADSFAYQNSNLSGNGGWSGAATTQVLVENQAIKISGGSGAYNALHSVGCSSGPVAVRVRANKGSGTSTIWNLYMNDTSGGDLGKWYGSGTSGRGRIGLGTPTGVGTFTGGWDELYVRIDFAANTTRFVFNGVVLGTPTHTGGEAIGSIKIERADSSSAAGQYVYMDDIHVGPPDIAPPSASIGAPAASVTKNGPVSFPVSFSEPVFGFSAASDVQVNATGTASAGAVGVTGSGVGPYTVTLSNITGSGTLGITVKASACTDVAANASVVSSASAVIAVVAVDGSVAAARQLANGSHVELCGKALYLVGSGFGYVEELNRSAGMRIQGTVTANENDIVCLSGTVQTTAGGEKYIQIDGIAPAGQSTVWALGTTNRALRSGLVDGLYVKTWGIVKPGSITGNSYMITDGSDDGGIKVITVGAPDVSANQFVTVVGAAGFDGGRLVYQR